MLMRWSLPLMVLALMDSAVMVLACSERVRAGLAGADAHGLFDRGDENLAVADLVGARRLYDRLDGPST